MPDSGTATTPDLSSAGANPAMSQLLSSAYTSLVASMKDVVSSAGGGGAGQSLANQAADLKAKASDEINIANEKAAIQLQQDNQANREALGLTPLAIAAKSRELAADEADIQQRQQMIQGKEDQGFFDNPIAFIGNQISLPFDKEALANRVTTLREKFQDLKETADLFDAGARANLASDTGASAARLKGLTDLDAANALAEKSDAAFKAAQIGVQAASVRVAASGEAYRAAIELNDSAVKQNQLDLQKQGLALQQKEYDLGVLRSNIEQQQNQRAAETHNLEMTIQGITASDAETRQKSYAELQGKLDQTMALLGANRMSVFEYQSLGTARKTQIDQLLADPDLAQGKLGFDPVKAIDTVNSGAWPLTPGINIVRKFLTDTINSTVDSLGPAIKSLDPDQIHVKELAAIKAGVSTEAKAIPPTGGIYSPPTLSSVLSIPALTQLPITKYLAPLAVSNNLYPTRPDDIFAQGAMMIANKEATPAEVAAQISTIYQAIAADNNQVRQYGRMQLPMLGPGTGGYNVTAQYGSGWGQSRTVNMLSESDIQNFLLRAMVTQSTYGASNNLIGNRLPGNR